MKIGFVELDDTILVPRGVQTEKHGSLKTVLEMAGTSTPVEGERTLLEGDGSFSIQHGWSSDSQLFRLEPAAGRFRLTNRRLCIIRPVIGSDKLAEVEKVAGRPSLVIDAIRHQRSEYVEIPIDEFRGYIGNRFLISSGNEDFRLEMNTPKGPGPIISKIPRIKRYTGADLKNHTAYVITGRHKQIGTGKYDAAAILLLFPIGFSLSFWMAGTAPVPMLFSGVFLSALATGIVALRLRIPNRLRVGPDGVTLISWLGRRHLPFSDIERFMPDKEYAETYESDSDGGTSIMVTKEYSGIRVNLWEGKEMFVAASPDDAMAALSYFIDTVPPDALRAIAGTEATESDWRKLHETAERLPKRVKTAMAVNSIIAAVMFIVVVWLAMQMLPDVNVRNEPQTLLSKAFFAFLIGSVCLGFELLTFGYYYGNHVEFLIDRLTGRIDALNKRVSGPPSSFNIYTLKEYRGLMVRTVLVGAVIIGAIMLVATLLSFANPLVDAVFVLTSGLSSAVLAGFAGYLLYKW